MSPKKKKPKTAYESAVKVMEELYPHAEREFFKAWVEEFRKLTR